MSKGLCPRSRFSIPRRTNIGGNEQQLNHQNKRANEMDATACVQMFATATTGIKSRNVVPRLENRVEVLSPP